MKMIHAKDMKNFKGEKKVEEKQENLLQNTMQEKAKYYGNRIWRDMSSLGKWANPCSCDRLYCWMAASSLFSYVLKTVTMSGKSTYGSFICFRCPV